MKEIDEMELVRFIMPFVALVAIVTCQLGNKNRIFSISADGTSISSDY